MPNIDQVIAALPEDMPPSRCRELADDARAGPPDRRRGRDADRMALGRRPTPPASPSSRTTSERMANPGAADRAAAKLAAATRLLPALRPGATPAPFGPARRSIGSTADRRPQSIRLERIPSLRADERAVRSAGPACPTTELARALRRRQHPDRGRRVFRDHARRGADTGPAVPRRLSTRARDPPAGHGVRLAHARRRKPGDSAPARRRPRGCGRRRSSRSTRSMASGTRRR